MSITRTLTKSFSGGEIAPELLGRIDLDKSQSSLSECSNFVPLAHGPIRNRPGTKFVNHARKSSAAVRLIPFQWSIDQTMVLEFGDLYIRFHTTGQTLLNNSQSITSITCGTTTLITKVAHGYTDGDSVYFLGITGTAASILNGRFMQVSYIDADHFSLIHQDGSLIDTASLTAVVTSATMATAYKVTTPYVADDIFDIRYVQNSDVLTLTHDLYAPRELRRAGALSWSLVSIAFQPSIATPTGLAVTPTGAGVGSTNYYSVTAVTDEDEESIATATSSIVVNNLSVANSKNTVSWAAVTGASYYKVYKATADGGTLGYIGRTSSLAFVDNNINPDAGRTVGTSSDAFNATGDYPKCCSYFEQRRIFAATSNNSQTVWMTQTGTETNLLSSVPSQDSDSIRFRMSARDHNAIEHVVPMNDLIILTSAGEWRAYAPNGDPITPSSLVIRPQSFTGCNSVTPALTAGSMIYVQFGGWSLRELSYSWESQTYKSTDLTAMAPHLFEEQTVTDMAFQRVPIPILWSVMDSGDLVTCTYMPEHKVIAFAQQSTENGAFESVCTVVEDSEDVVYFVVRRDVVRPDTGATVSVRMIERLSEMKQPASVVDAFHVDCGATYSGTAATTITGLWHLEGKTLACLTDGAVHPQVTVSDGQITLNYPASKVHVGYPITSTAVTMPIAVETPDGAVSNVKNVNRVWMTLKKTSGIEVGPSDGDLIDITTRSTESYDSPPDLVTGVLEVPIMPSYSNDWKLKIQQANPLPAMIMSISFEVVLDA